MWYENSLVDNARLVLGVPLSPLWTLSCATAHEVGSPSMPSEGHLFIFSCMVAFLDNSPDAIPLFRLCYDQIENVLAEGDDTIRLVADGCVYKLWKMEERNVACNALTWLQDQYIHADDIDELARGAILYPNATRRLHSLSDAADDEPEYVVQEVDGAVITNHRILFATTVVRLSNIAMLHVGEDYLKIVVSKDLILHLHCSLQRQTLVSSVWLASLPISTDLLLRVAQNPQQALKTHVKTLQRLHLQFCAIDTSRDGVLSSSELTAGVGCLFGSSDFVDGFFVAMDSDGNEEISLIEFLTGISTLLTGDVVSRTRFSFRMFDRDKNGTLDRDELFMALQTLQALGDVHGSAEMIRDTCEELFHIMDSDRSGTITVEEYTTALFQNSSVRRLFRSLGMFDVTHRDNLRLTFADRYLLASDPMWSTTAAVMQALKCGLASSSSQRAQEALTDTDYSAVLSLPVYAQPDALRRLGTISQCAGGEGSVVEVLAPRVFERVRMMHDVLMKSLMRSLGVNTVAANLLLGSTSTLHPSTDDSGRVRFVSGDDQFVVCVLSSEEFSRIFLVLSQYVQYLTTNPNTCLPRWLGLFTLRAHGYQLHLALLPNFARRWPRSNHVEVLFDNQPQPRRGVKSRDTSTKTAMSARLLTDPIQLMHGWRDPLVRQLERDINLLQRTGFSNFTVVCRIDDLPESTVKNATKDFLKLLKTVSTTGKSKGGCCTSASPIKQSPMVTTQQIRVGVAARAFAALDESPAFRRSQSRLALTGGMFRSIDGGTPTLHSRPALFMFGDVLSHGPQESTEGLLKLINDVIQGEMDVQSETLKDVTSRMYPVTTETGVAAFVGVDHSQRQLHVVDSAGHILMNINLVFAAAELSFVRDLLPFTDQNRRKLVIRSGVHRQGKPAVVDFMNRRTFLFDSIVAREMLLSEAYCAMFHESHPIGTHTRRTTVMNFNWNAGERIPGDLRAALKEAHANCDLVCVACQDCTYPVRNTSCALDWTARILAALPDFELVSTACMWSTRSVVLVRSELAQFVSNISKATTGSSIGNRNAVGVGLKFFESSLCFVNARFAERGDDESSVEEFFDFLEGLEELGVEGLGVLSSYQHIFVSGDFKHRSRSTIREVLTAAERHSFDALVANDRLSHELRNGLYCGFQEAPITFGPTSRLLPDTIGTERVYDEWRQEVPTWSHRILYRNGGHPADDGRCVRYSSDSTLRTSTFVPVYALHEVTVRKQQVLPSSLNNRLATHLVIDNLGCRGLSRSDVYDACDPWIRFLFPYFQDPPSRTKTYCLSNTTEPRWDETFELPLVPCDPSLIASDYLHFMIYDEDHFHQRDLVGTASIPMHKFADSVASRTPISVPILSNGRRNGTLTASISLRFSM